MRTVLASIEGEFRRYRQLGEGAMGQLADAELLAARGNSDNPIAIIVRHLGGNLRSRFTDFLTTDGEKPWRNRDGEFVPREMSRGELMADWESGWSTLLATLAALTDAHLGQTVTIRGQQHLAIEALHRALAHVAYHVGQIVYLAKSLRGDAWTSLSIPPGGSVDYNRNPTRERTPGTLPPRP